jgi:hypothetical protein
MQIAQLFFLGDAHAIQFGAVAATHIFQAITAFGLVKKNPGVPAGDHRLIEHDGVVFLLADGRLLRKLKVRPGEKAGGAKQSGFHFPRFQKKARRNAFSASRSLKNKEAERVGVRLAL